MTDKDMNKLADLIVDKLLTTYIREQATWYTTSSMDDIYNTFKQKPKVKSKKKDTESELLGELAKLMTQLNFHQDKEEYEECENEIHELVEQKPGYDYWLARGIILLADVYIVKGDNFNARYSLESVISGYKGDDDIIPMAQEKLLQIDELENKDVENSTNEETEEIDIGGDEGLRKKNHQYSVSRPSLLKPLC